jgi:hypothetical protein
MAKLSEQEIKDILASKGLVCSNIDEYQNLDTILKLKCKNNHNLEASMRTIRNAHFKCPQCEGQASISERANNIQVPDKKGFRLVAIDNATHNAGISVFDDDKLVFYKLYKYEGDTITRMVANRQFLEDIVIKTWNADMIVLEDIQYQNNNIMTFKTLAMLLGSSLVSCAAQGIKTETVLSKVWRSHFMIAGKSRIEEKKGAIDKVKLMYNITVNDDVAEAILLGKYAVDKLRINKVKQLF